jgi:hypothetical protein
VTSLKYPTIRMWVSQIKKLIKNLGPVMLCCCGFSIHLYTKKIKRFEEKQVSGSRVDASIM